MRVEIFVKDLRSLLAEVPTFSPKVIGMKGYVVLCGCACACFLIKPNNNNNRKYKKICTPKKIILIKTQCLYVCILRVATVMVRPVLETERLEIWHSVGNFFRDEHKLVPFHSC